MNYLHEGASVILVGVVRETCVVERRSVGGRKTKEARARPGLSCALQGRGGTTGGGRLGRLTLGLSCSVLFRVVGMAHGANTLMN